jgi:hypothetical protein
MALTAQEMPVGSGKERRRGTITNYTETGADDTQLVATLTVAAGFRKRVLMVIVVYDDTATQAGVTVAIDLDNDFTATLLTGDADEETTVFNVPVTQDLILGADDDLVVTAPAGGTGVAASVLIVTEDV